MVRFKAGSTKTQAKTETAVSTGTVKTEPEKVAYTPAAYAELNIAEYRGRFPAETKPFSDRQLFDVVMETEDDMDDADWKELFLSRKPNAPDTVDGDKLAAHAAALGAKASLFMSETLERIAKAREDWQGGPIYTLIALQDAYSDEELSEFPIPGSEFVPNPDKFSMTVYNGDKKGTKRTTFYAQFARNTTKGKEYVQRLDWLERAADKGMSKEGIPDDILSMDHDERVREASFINGRIATMTQAYKKAAQLHFKMVEVNNFADNIFADFDWQDKYSPDDVDNASECKLEKGNEPIIVWTEEPGKPSKREPFSIAAFLKLNTKKAEERGGGFKALVESGATKKAPVLPGQAPAPGKDEPSIKSADTGVATIVETHRWFVEISEAKDGAEYGKLVQMLTKAGNDEYVTAAVELKNFLIDVCKNNGLDQKYIKLKAKGSELVSDTKVPNVA